MVKIYDIPDLGMDKSQNYIFSSSSLTAYLASDIAVPDDFSGTSLYSGCYYVIGTDSRLGEVTIYIPADVDADSWGLTDSGYLVYVGSSSVTAYCSDTRNNTVSFSRFGTGTYSLQSGNSYQSYTLQLVPSASNLQIQTELKTQYSITDFIPYLFLLIGGVIALCCMTRSRS